MKQELFNKLENIKITDFDSKKVNLNLYNNYFKEFYNKYPSLDLKKLAEITYEELMISFFLIVNASDVAKTLKVIEKYPQLFKEYHNSELLASLMLYYNDEYFASIIDKYISTTGIIKMSKLKSEILYAAKYRKEIIGKFEMAAKFVEEYGKDEDLKSILFDIEAHMWIETIDFYNACLETNSIISSVSKDRLKIKGNRLIIDNYFFEEVLEFTNEQYQFLEKIYIETFKKLDNEIKDINRLNKKIDRLIANLNVVGEIKNIDEIMSICPEELKNEVLDYVIEHNKKYYISLVEKYETLKKNSIENISLLFTRYKYCIDDLTEENKVLIKKIGYDNIEKILQILNKYNINVDINKIVLLDIKKLETIEELIISGVLTNIFIQENINIIYSNNEILTLILKNITLLSENNINIKNYNNSLSVLLNENLENSLFILKEYNLSITRETSCILFLNDLDLIDKIDLIITLGIYDNISNLDILNSNVLVLLKEKELKTLNIDCEKIDLSKIEVSSFNNSNEFVPVYYLNVLNSEYKNEISLPEFLEQYKINDFVLSINGVLVSINRLLRNLSKFDNIDEEKVLYSIIYNSYYSLEEMENLSETLTKKDVYSLVRSL